jgi:hypothetical protein
MSEQNKALMSRIIEELWNKKNPAVIGQLYAENYVGHTPDGVLKATPEHGNTMTPTLRPSLIPQSQSTAWWLKATRCRYAGRPLGRIGANSPASRRPASGSPCPGTSRSASPAARLSKTTPFGTR